MDECITMGEKPKGHYWKDTQWDVNGIRYEVSGSSAMSLRIGQLTLVLLRHSYTGVVVSRSYYAMQSTQIVLWM